MLCLRNQGREGSRESSLGDPSGEVGEEFPGAQQEFPESERNRKKVPYTFNDFPGEEET